MPTPNPAYDEACHIIHDHFKEYARRHENVMTPEEGQRLVDLEYSILNAILVHAHANEETSASSILNQMDIFELLGE